MRQLETEALQLLDDTIDSVHLSEIGEYEYALNNSIVMSENGDNRNFGVPFDELIEMIKTVVNKEKYGDHSEILCRRFGYGDEPERFLTEKYVVFEAKRYWDDERRNWLRMSLPEDFEIGDLEKGRLIAKLKLYLKKRQGQSKDFGELKDQLKQLEARIAQNGQETMAKLNYLAPKNSNQEDRWNRPNNRYRSNYRKDNRDYPRPQLKQSGAKTRLLRAQQARSDRSRREPSLPPVNYPRPHPKLKTQTPRRGLHFPKRSTPTLEPRTKEPLHQY